MSLLQRLADTLPYLTNLDVVCNTYLVLTGVRPGAVLELEDVEDDQKDALYRLVTSEFPLFRILRWNLDHEWIIMRQTAFMTLTVKERADLMTMGDVHHSAVLGRCIGYPVLPPRGAPNTCTRVSVMWGKQLLQNSIMHAWMDEGFVWDSPHKVYEALNGRHVCYGDASYDDRDDREITVVISHPPCKPVSKTV